MRKFVIDKVLYLLFGIAIGIGIYVFERYIVLTVIFETILITCLASQCSPLFALLIDVFKGSVTKEVYLSGKIISWGYDFLAEATILNGNFTMGATTYSGFVYRISKIASFLKK